MAYPIGLLGWTSLDIVNQVGYWIRYMRQQLLISQHRSVSYQSQFICSQISSRLWKVFNFHQDFISPHFGLISVAIMYKDAGKAHIGLDHPNKSRTMVGFPELGSAGNFFVLIKEFIFFLLISGKCFPKDNSLNRLEMTFELALYK